MKSRHHPREHVDRKGGPGPSDRIAGFFVHGHHVHSGVIDLNDGERARGDIVARRRLRGFDRGLVSSAQRHRARVEIFDPRFDSSPIRRGIASFNAAEPDLLHQLAELRLLPLEVELTDRLNDQRFAFWRERS